MPLNAFHQRKRQEESGHKKVDWPIRHDTRALALKLTLTDPLLNEDLPGVIMRTSDRFVSTSAALDLLVRDYERASAALGPHDMKIPEQAFFTLRKDQTLRECHELVVDLSIPDRPNLQHWLRTLFPTIISSNLAMEIYNARLTVRQTGIHSFHDLYAHAPLIRALVGVCFRNAWFLMRLASRVHIRNLHTNGYGHMHFEINGQSLQINIRKWGRYGEEPEHGILMGDSVQTNSGVLPDTLSPSVVYMRFETLDDAKAAYTRMLTMLA